MKILASTLVTLSLVACPAAHAGPPIQGITPQRVELGRKLAFDKRLSANGRVSCMTCHQPERGYSDGLRQPTGIALVASNRNTPTMIGAAYSPFQFLDGRTDGIVAQAGQPLVNPNEMGNDSQQQVARRLNRIAGYRDLFAAAYGTLPTTETMRHAIASFESTLLSMDAPIDRRMQGDVTALSPEAESGFQIALVSRCFECHKPPLYTDNLFHNTGVTFETGGGDQGRINIVPNEQRAETPEQRRAFKTPTLRGVMFSGPYMHNGRLDTLEQVIAHYANGGSRQATVAERQRTGGNIVRDRLIDNRVQNLGLDATQRSNLAVFIREAFANYPVVSEPTLP